MKMVERREHGVDGLSSQAGQVGTFFLHVGEMSAGWEPTIASIVYTERRDSVVNQAASLLGRDLKMYGSHSSESNHIHQRKQAPIHTC